MKCPVCAVDLVMTDRQGVEIDYCSQCRGIWLDRGELDKIIERSYEASRPSQPPQGAYQQVPPQGAPYGGNQHHRERGDDDDEHGYDEHGRRKRRGNWLTELFD